MACGRNDTRTVAACARLICAIVVCPRVAGIIKKRKECLFPFNACMHTVCTEDRRGGPNIGSRDRETHQSKIPIPARNAPAVKPTAAKVILLLPRCELRAEAPLDAPAPLFCEASPVAAGRPLEVAGAEDGARPIVATTPLLLSDGSYDGTICASKKLVTAVATAASGLPSVAEERMLERLPADAVNNVELK